ncbi:MAG: tetratricopeptide repeat protein [bacterium]
MFKRPLIILSMFVALIVAVAPQQTVHGIHFSAVQLTIFNRLILPNAVSSDPAEKQDAAGNRFLRALKAPFKAIGRLFGRGKKDNHKLERLSEKDIKNFESSPADQIRVATVAQTQALANPDDNLQGNAAAHLEKGQILLDNGRLNEAIEQLSMAASMDPALAEAHNLLGVAYDSKGLSRLATRAFDMALKLDGKSAETLNNLGYLLYRNGDYRGAADRLKKAAKLAPDNALILNNLALAQSQLGKFDDAYKNFARAGGEITGRLNVANQLEIAGRSEEALKHYEAARLKAQQSASLGTQEITVVVKVQNGRITFASVKNHRPGMEAYEASALRLVRERQFPANKNGQNSIVVRISPLPVS